MKLNFKFGLNSKNSRTVLVVLASMGLLLASFLFGLRSAIQKDKAYFWTKEIKVIAYHEYNLFKDWLGQSGQSEGGEQPGEVKVFTANDFTIELIHLDGFGHTEKTAGFVPGARGKLIKYEQASASDIWAHLKFSEVVSDAEPTRYRGGGLKQIFRYKGEDFGLISMVDAHQCYFASLMNLTRRKEVFRAPCLPDVDELDFSSIGGAWSAADDGIIMSLGTPADDAKIAVLAQDPASPYGKILRFSDSRLMALSPDRDVFSIHSAGHRNPQGMVRVGEAVYAVDHGPKGGDEINLIVEGKNYGWPSYSLGSSYQGKPHRAVGDPKQFVEPLFAFVPSIAPSDITVCPAALSQRYAPLSCVLLASLRGMSLYVGLIDADHRVVSIEPVLVNMRLREFVRLPGGRLGVSTDDYGVFEIKLHDLTPPW